MTDVVVGYGADGSCVVTFYFTDYEVMDDAVL